VGKYSFKRFRKQWIDRFILSRIENHSDFIEVMFTFSEEVNDCIKSNRGCELDRVSKCSGRNGWERNAAQVVTRCDLQASTIGARQQLRFALVTTTPNRTNSMNDVPSFEISPSRDNRIADGTASYFPASFINLRSTFCVNGAVRARSLIEPPMRGGDNCVGLLVRNIPVTSRRTVSPILISIATRFEI
jgi:hypothetical protein